VLVHSGDTEYGHYYSYIYDRREKQWYCFNDHKVEKVDEKVVT
jgi:ubiquitin C-terminal hydrolase